MISRSELDILRNIRSNIRDVLLSANADEETYDRASNCSISAKEIRTLASAILTLDYLTGDETTIWSDLGVKA